MERSSQREPLTREAVVAAGLAIGDAEGLEAVSLRRIAADVGVTPMALYRYVGSKEELLDEMLDAVWENVEIPDLADDDWWGGLAALARSTRAAFLSHPAAATIAATRAGGGEGILRVIEAILTLFERAGLDPQRAVRIFPPFARSLLALIVFEASLLPELSEEERRRQALRNRFEFESLPADGFPHVIAAASLLAMPYEAERVFEEGLELLHAGIEAQLPAATRGD
jgi:AcrR family transcriptional regulator